MERACQQQRWWRDKALTPSSGYRQAASAARVSRASPHLLPPCGPIHLGGSAARAPWSWDEGTGGGDGGGGLGGAPPPAGLVNPQRPPQRPPGPPRPPPPPAPEWYVPVRLARLQWMLLEPTRRKEETQAGCGDPSGRLCLRDPFQETRHHDPRKGIGISPTCTILHPSAPRSLSSQANTLDHYKHPPLALVGRSSVVLVEVRGLKGPFQGMGRGFFLPNRPTSPPPPPPPGDFGISGPFTGA